MVQNDRQEGQGLFDGGDLVAFADAAASNPHRLIRASLWKLENRKTKTIVFGGFSQGSDIIGIIGVTALSS